jgi:hypothetical protein
MTIEQTVDIPASRRLTIEVPPEVPVGRTILAFTPVPAVPPVETAEAESDAEYHRRKARAAKDIELINSDAEWLNREMADVLLDQVDL